MHVLLDQILVCVLYGEERSTGSLPQATDGGAWQACGSDSLAGSWRGVSWHQFHPTSPPAVFHRKHTAPCRRAARSRQHFHGAVASRQQAGHVRLP